MESVNNSSKPERRFELIRNEDQAPLEDHLRLINVAEALIDAGLVDDGFTVFETALRDTNDDVEKQARVFYDRAQANRRLGRALEALNDLKEAQSRILVGGESLPNKILLYRIERLGELIVETTAEGTVIDESAESQAPQI